MKYLTNLYRYGILHLFMVYTAVGQQQQLRPYTLEDGLPQSQVYDIIQDDVGYLWLGTQGGGLCNFDGEKFTTWNTTDGLLSNYIHALSYTKDSLFIGTKRGLSIKTEHAFTNFKSPPIHTLYSTNDSLFLGTTAGIYTYNRKKGIHKLHLHPEIDNSTIQDIIFDGTQFWIATTKALWKLNSLQHKNTIITKYSVNNFTSIVSYGTTIFAATYTDGILVIDTKNSEDILIREPLRIQHIALLHDQLWVATDHDGITVIDPNDDYRELQRIGTSQGLHVSHVRKTSIDRQSNIWIATSGGGIYKYFLNNFKQYGQATGLKGHKIHAVHHAKNGLWVSNATAGLVHIDTSGIHHIPKAPQLSEAKIKTITSDTKDDIWAGTNGSGIWYRATTQTDSIITDSVEVLGVLSRDTIHSTTITNHIIDTDKGLPSDWIRTLCAQDNTIWAATYTSGIINFRYYPDKDSLGIRNTFNKQQGIKDLYLMDLKEDPQGRMWYSTQHGHLGYIDDGIVTDLGKVIHHDIVINTIRFHQQKIWIGTAGHGVWSSNYTTLEPFKKLQGEKRLASENIYQLIFDDQEHLWIGTERGLDKVVLNQEQHVVDIVHFDRNNGFSGIETCLNAVEKDLQGDLWFGTINGLTKYQTSEIEKPILHPKLHFETVAVAYTTIDTIALPEWTNSNHILALQPHQNQLSFSYRTIDIDHPNAVQYRFRLNTSDWSPWSYENRQNLAGLAYGPHTFIAQSRNYRWEESDPIRFQFYIHRPFYEKAWFQWMVLAVIIGILVWITIRYIKTIKRKNRQEQERLEIKNHLLSLEHKALQLQMNPHFIFNVLNGIKAMGGNDIQKMNTTINTFAMMLRETLYNSRKDHITLAQELNTLKHYIALEQLMTSKSFIYDSTIDTDTDIEEVLIPPMLIQPFVENAIRHGILKGTHQGKLQIDFKIQSEWLTCTITDNGIGIFQSQKRKQKTDHQSIALKVTKERLASIAGTDTLTLKELTDTNGIVTGTQVTFTLPILTDY